MRFQIGGNKMKKIFIFGMVFLLMMTLALAQGNQERQEIQEKPCTACIGLNNAILRVHNVTQEQHLQQVMNKIQEQRILQFQKFYNFTVEEIDDEVLIEGKADAKLFGLIKAKHTYKFKVMEDGSVERVRNWNDFLFRHQEGITDDDTTEVE
jgi:hypothetical protein